MADLFVHRAPKSLAVIPFYATAAVFFLGFSIMLFISSAELTGHHFHPHLLAIVHAVVLGWSTMIILGAVYQLLPVLCEGDLYSHRLAFTSYLFLLVGTILLVWCFWVFQAGPWLITAGTIVVLSTCLYLYNVCATVICSSKSTVYQYFIVSSAVWLLLTTVAGLLLAINLTYTFIPRNHMDMLKLHAHAGIVGWFLQLICGVSAKLVPMFLLGKSKRSWLLYLALILQNLGLVLFLFHAYFRQINGVVFIHILLISIGIILWGIYIAEAYIKRIRKKIDLLMKQTLLSFAFKPLAIGALLMTFVYADTKWVNLYGILIFLGWITGIIISKTFKTLPFIVWNNLYKDVHGNVQIPLPKNLYSQKLITYQSYLFVIAVGALCLGMVINLTWFLQIATALWVLLALLYCYNVATVIFHKSRIHHEHHT
ncbi:hypothetical protein FAZ15_15155 [Sphingobacterium olei]|uniref:Cytochrome C oxidase subunit I n=1 Tax=Sphingobacterium olei TaxID=2571155 RepID=A0A4U0NKC9_9SPHI|nr:hypothetical protein [Sphingobacterium olei]TJZ54809.1 hypothetical protein FAZ15_15155 [Sphingobacterium olei]